MGNNRDAVNITEAKYKTVTHECIRISHKVHILKIIIKINFELLNNLAFSYKWKSTHVAGINICVGVNGFDVVF